MADDQITIPFVGGPDDQTDPRLLPPGSVISAFNQIYDTDGSYQPRFGVTQLANGPSVVKRLAVFINELLSVDGANLWTWNAQGAAWQSKDSVTPVGVTHRPVWAADTTYQSWDEAVGSGYRVIAWVDVIDNRCRAAVYDITTGACVYGPTLLVTGSAGVFQDLQVGIVGTTAIVTAHITTTLHGWTLALSPLGTWSGSSTQLTSGGSFSWNGNPVYAVTYMSATLAIAYEHFDVTGGNNVTKIVQRSFNTSLALQVETATTIETNPTGGFAPLIQCLALKGTTGENLWCGYSANAGSSTPVDVSVFRSDPSTLVKSAGPFAFAANQQPGTMAIERLSSTKCLIVSSIPSFGQSASWQQFTTSGASGSVSTVNNMVLVAGPVYIASLSTAVVMFANLPAAGSYYLVDLQTGITDGTALGSLLAILAPRIVNAQTLSSVVPHMVPGATGIYETTLPVSRATGRWGLNVFKVDTAAAYRWSPLALGRELYLSGQYYDGNRVVETGYSYSPIIASTGSSGSGSLTGTWQYVATYARVDAAGNLEESAPSAPFSVTATSKLTLTVTLNTMTMTRKQRPSDLMSATAGQVSNIYCILYRQQALGSGDTTFYRVNVEPFPAANVNPITSGQITISDTLTDAQLTDGTHPVLYTQTGELPHNCPETFTHAIVHKNRPVGIGADQRTIWVGQVYVDALVPAWNETVTFSVDDTNEPLVALGSLYDKLIVFTQTKVYVVFGDGPSISGAGNDFTQPQRVPSPAGCIESRSVVNTPFGVFFQSLRGIELLGPDLSVTFQGKKAASTTKSFPICTGAAFCEDTSTVRWTFTSSEAAPNSGNGVVLVYDVRRDRWAVHQITCGGNRGNVAGAPMQSCVWHPTLGFVAAHNDNISASLIYRENTAADATPWLDFGTYFVPLTVQMAWVRSGQGDLESWQRVRRMRLLGQYFDAHGLRVQFDYDYNGGAEVHSVTSQTIAVLFGGPMPNGYEQMRFIPKRGKSEALGVTLATVAPTNPQVLGTGRGAGFTGVAFEIRPKKGGYRNLPAAAKVG